MNENPHIHALKIAIGVMILLIGISYWPNIVPKNNPENFARKEKPANFFANLRLEAKAVYVYDLSKNKILFAKNETEALPLASLTKIMTAFTALSMAPEVTLITIDKASIKAEGDSGLRTDEEWTLKELLQYTLVASSNDGATAIASNLGEAFVNEMNLKAQQLGLSTMHFNNPSGLDLSKIEAGAYGSAKDISALLSKAVETNPDVFEPTRYASFQTASVGNISHKTKNTNEIVDMIPGFVAGKTGYSDLAGGNLAVIFDVGVGHPIAIAILGSSYDGRFSDMKKLVGASVATVAR